MRKISLSDEYLNSIAMSELTGLHYKVLLLLIVEPASQSQIAEKLNAKKQTIHPVFKTLEKLNCIKVSQTIGRSKIYSAVTDVRKLEVNKVDKNQMKFNC